MMRFDEWRLSRRKNVRIDRRVADASRLQVSLPGLNPCPSDYSTNWLTHCDVFQALAESQRSGWFGTCWSETEGGQNLAGVLKRVMTEVGHCQQCRNFSMQPICSMCSDESRDASIICVVETPADVMAVEQSGSFRGRYFLTMSNLSPIDGIGPDEIGADALVRLCQGGVTEVILALDSTVEGEATGHFLYRKPQSDRRIGVANRARCPDGWHA